MTCNVLLVSQLSSITVNLSPKNKWRPDSDRLTWWVIQVISFFSDTKCGVREVFISIMSFSIHKSNKNYRNNTFTILLTFICLLSVKIIYVSTEGKTFIHTISTHCLLVDLDGRWVGWCYNVIVSVKIVPNLSL